MIIDLPGYDEAPAFTGDFEKLPPGGYICQVLTATVEDWTRGVGRSLVLKIEIVHGEYSGFFKRQWENDTRPDKKWPCVYRQNIPELSSDYYKTSLGFFKGMITAFEKSNKNFIWDKNIESLHKKNAGFIFAEEEYEARDGTIKTVVKPIQVRSVDKILAGDFKVPEKKLNKYTALDAKVETVNDDELPF